VKSGERELSEIDLVEITEWICNTPWETFKGMSDKKYENYQNVK